jgi:hypothetical protein
MNVSIQKTIALVVALAKLHNFCIVEANNTIVLPGTAIDQWQNEVNGAVSLVQLTQHPESGGVTPQQLLDGGHRFDKVNVGNNGRYNWQRRYNYMSAIIIIIIPPTMGFVMDVWAFKIITIFVDLIIHDWGGGFNGLLHAYGYNQL